MNHSGAGSRPRGGMGWPQQWTVLADLAAVLVFVAIGLSAHGHKESAANLAQVSAPFLVGALPRRRNAARRPSQHPFGKALIISVSVTSSPDGSHQLDASA